MSVQCEVTAKQVAKVPMSVFERYLTVWVFLCIVVGITLGQMLPGPFQAIGRMEIAKVNLPVALLIWLMIVPMLVKIDFAALRQVTKHWRGIGVTLFVNWAVKPFSMALLGWLFIGWLFRPWLPAEQIDSYIAGLILLAAAPCTAMVFVWSYLSGGDLDAALLRVARALMHRATSDVVAVFGQVGQVAEVRKGANHTHGLVAAEALEQLLEGLVGFVVGVAPKRHRELADLFDQLERGHTFLLADHIPQQSSEQPDVFYQWALVVLGRGLGARLVQVGGGGGGGAVHGVNPGCGTGRAGQWPC